jgi:hypothetical protein
MTTSKELTPEEIHENYERFETLLLKKTGDRAEACKALLEELGERIAVAPASSREAYHQCFPGGLVDHSLRVLKNALALKNTYELEIPVQSLVIACLFHDLGKVGDRDEEYYLPQDSDWHRDKLGENYKHNPDIQFMKVPHRSLFLLQQFGVELSRDEYIAILIHDGQHDDTNRHYRLKEPCLADVVAMADFISTKQEKGQFG